MKRDPRAFLSDVIEAGHAIQQAVAGINLDDYSNSRLLLKKCTQLLSELDGGSS